MGGRAGSYQELGVSLGLRDHFFAITGYLRGVSESDTPLLDASIGLVFFIPFLVYPILTTRGLKRRNPKAWKGQVFFSVVGLLGFSLGTAIFGYILSQWFKPETKAWCRAE